MKLVHGITAYSQMYRADKYSKHSSIMISLAEWLSVRLRTKWLWVQVPLLSLKLQILGLFRAKGFDIQATTECRFSLKRVRGKIATYSQMHCTDM